MECKRATNISFPDLLEQRKEGQKLIFEPYRCLSRQAK